MRELPETKEIISVLLSYGDSTNMILIDYNHAVYGRKITAMYYITDGLLETYKTISIFAWHDQILVQIDEDVMSYEKFKEVYMNG